MQEITARVIGQYRMQYRVRLGREELRAVLPGKAMFTKDQRAYPTVGDYVLLDRADNAHGDAVILRVQPRSSLLVRRAAGPAGGDQLLAANVTHVLLCMSLNRNFNLRRLERYLTLAAGSGAQPVIVLTKADACPEAARYLDLAAAVAGEACVVATSTRTGEGLEQLRALRGGTLALLGSSGVGKSTLINALLVQEAIPTQQTGKLDKGRHTTTIRQLWEFADGTSVIDTPGMRELGLEEGDLESVFPEVEALAAACRFRDCRHESEPGCAVRAAVDCGELPMERLRNYFTLRKELERAKARRERRKGG